MKHMLVPEELLISNSSGSIHQDVLCKDETWKRPKDFSTFLGELAYFVLEELNLIPS